MSNNEVMMNPDMFREFLCCGKKSNNVLGYVLLNVNQETNVLVASLDEIAKGSGVTKVTASKIMTDCLKAGLMRKAGSYTWMLNPRAYYVGSDRERALLLREYSAYPEYDELQKNYVAQQ